ncbi:uncharacterized protein A4U43_C03F17090 [Asparagus officinalis]|uniref:Uncharacterized protein n=1 Tax=Asparagus officinalis TaxID=4686 RepID=A0A5P1FBB3_ASPOF|nr:uncharacterized protein A4U43_C03F17090 [Asparagus officinalis]
MDLERNETGRKAGRGEVELAAANCAEIAEVAPATAAAEISLTRLIFGVYHGPRWKAAFIFVGGFWVLDFANNAVQGPARALMADLSGRFGCNAANAIFASWMAFGNILGYSSGSTGEWHNWFPFLKTRACCDACANLKGAFLVAVVFLLLSMLVTLIVAKEVPLCSIPGKGEEEHRAEFLDIFRSIKNLPPGMPSVLAQSRVPRYLQKYQKLASWNAFSTFHHRSYLVVMVSIHPV